MRSTVERLDPVADGPARVRLTLELSAAEVEAPADLAAGPPPPEFVAAVSARVRAALAEHGLVPLRLPEIKVGRTGDGEPLVASAVVELRPALLLPDLPSVEVVLPAAAPDPGADADAWVEARLGRIRAEYVDLTPVGRPARAGDHVRLGVSAAVEGGGVWAPADGVEVVLGSGALLIGLDEALTGLRAGEEATFETRVPDGPDAGREARVTVAVQAVLHAGEPELDDAFAAAVGPYRDLGELRAGLRALWERERRVDQLVAAREAVLAAVTAASGLDPDREADREAVLDVLAEAEGIEVTVDELRALIASEMGRSGVSARTYRKHLARDGVAAGLHEYARREKALAFLLRQVVVRDAAGDAVSFDAPAA